MSSEEYKQKVVDRAAKIAAMMRTFADNEPWDGNVMRDALFTYTAIMMRSLYRDDEELDEILKDFVMHTRNQKAPKVWENK